MSKLTRPSNKCIHRPVCLTPNLGACAFEMGIEITSVLWSGREETFSAGHFSVGFPKITDRA